MAFPVFLDTNALYNASLCDTLLRLAEEGTFRPQWSADVLDELSANLVSVAALTPAAASRRIDCMRQAFPDADVTGYAGLQAGLTCHSKDRHVLAAAIRGHSSVLVTFNVKDFPPSSVDLYELAVLTPDEFLLGQLDLYPASVRQALCDQILQSSNPPLQWADLLSRLTRAGAPNFVEAVRRQNWKCLPATER